VVGVAGRGARAPKRQGGGRGEVFMFASPRMGLWCGVWGVFGEALQRKGGGTGDKKSKNAGVVKGNQGEAAAGPGF